MRGAAPRAVRVLVGLVATLLLLGLTSVPTQAAPKVPKVAGISRAGQDWYHGKLLVRWRPVRGASYQMRWADAPARLAASPVLSTRTPRGTYTSTLDRGRTWYVQVRAVRGAKVGAWSRTARLRFQNSWPAAPSLRATGQPGAVRYDWGYTPFASRYRVLWNPAWYGNWPGAATYVDKTSGGWVGQGARSSTLTVPATPAPGDGMIAVDYANPVFARIEAGNVFAPGSRKLSPWVPAFPTPPTPTPGDRVRVGSYNVQLFPSAGADITAIAKNIGSRGIEVVALQEANRSTASALVSRLGSGTWASTGSGAGQQILYRKDRFTLQGSGDFQVRNPRSTSSPLLTPWALLRATSSSRPGSQQPFYVVSAHFSEDPTKSRLEQNRDTGESAKDVIAAMRTINREDRPIIVAGDLRYGREPFGENPGYVAAQPTLVRAGYYDAMAATTRIGSQYSTLNAVNGANSSRQAPHPTGLGPRSDHILIKGARGSLLYQNVVNFSDGGVVPSDHNLILADLQIPYLP